MLSYLRNKTSLFVFKSVSVISYLIAYPISKAKPSHPMKETHFSRMYPQSHCFGHYPKLMTIREGWNIDQMVNLKLCLSIPFTTTVQYNTCIIADVVSKCLSITYSIFPSLVKTPRYLIPFPWDNNSPQPGCNNPQLPGGEPWPTTWRC